MKKERLLIKTSIGSIRETNDSLIFITKKNEMMILNKDILKLIKYSFNNRFDERRF